MNYVPREGEDDSMLIYIIRHAWAGHFGDPQWPDDFRRPLTAKGKERFAKVVDVLSQRGLQPEVVATSPLIRCRQTAEIVVNRLPGRPHLVERNELEPGSDLPGIIAWTLREAPGCRQVAWVGHAPDVGEMTAALIGHSRASIRFAKGAVAAIDFEDQPGPGEGELRWLVTAKVLGCY
jgi:phosphohistidine phosphatase